MNCPFHAADMQRMKKEVIALSLLLSLACVVCLADDLVGEKAPEIKIKEWVTDNPPDLRSLEGRVRVLDFWATWCGPCVSNIPHLVNIGSKYKSMGVEFIALSQDKSPDKVLKFAREKGMNYNIAIDNGTVDRFKITSYPTAVVISHTGKVIWKGLPWESGFEQAIAGAAAKAGSENLQNVNLEPFSQLKESDPMEGSCFAGAYTASDDVDKAQTSNVFSMGEYVRQMDCETKVLCVLQIIVIINQRIYDIYADIVTKYGVTEVAEPAKTAYLEFKNYPDSREFPFRYDWLMSPVTSMQENRPY